MKRICGAKKRNKDEFCKSPAMANGRCRIHGGKTPKGIGSPHFKTGAHSKYLRPFAPANDQFEPNEKIQQVLLKFAKGLTEPCA